MTKNKFVKVMNSLEKKYKEREKWLSSIDILNDNFYENFYIYNFLYDTLEIIESEIIGEEIEGWLEYIFCDCSCDFKKIDITIDDADIAINSWEDVYDFLESRRG